MAHNHISSDLDMS